MRSARPAARGDGQELQHERSDGELEPHGDPVDPREDEHPEEQLDGARPADEDEHVVHEHRDDEDVEDVVPSERAALQELVDELGH